MKNRIPFRLLLLSIHTLKIHTADLTHFLCVAFSLFYATVNRNLPKNQTTAHSLSIFKPIIFDVDKCYAIDFFVCLLLSKVCSASNCIFVNGN